MPNWFSQLRYNTVWSAVVAAVAGALSLATALLSGGLELIVGFGVLGLILAVLSQK